MKFSTLSKAGFAASVCAALTAVSAGVAQAGTLQDTIFAKVEPSARDRMFFRLSYINVNVKTTAKDAYDVTGPVLGRNDVDQYLVNNYVSMFESGGSSLDQNYGLADVPLQTGFSSSELLWNCPTISQGLGTPCGIRAKSATRMATAAMSLGYYLTDDQDWSVEALLLGAPLKASVYGDGQNGLNGKKIIDTKLLPPMVVLSKYFGEKGATFRPYLGLSASYAVFFDTKATQELNAYQGGGSLGDTSVRIKNVFGVGPVAGFKIEPAQSSWKYSLALGAIRYKTDATITTRNTKITAESAVLKDYSPYIEYAIVAGSNIFRPTGGNAITVKTPGTPSGLNATDGQGNLAKIPLTTALMCDLAKAKYGSTDCSHGTFVRKAANALDSTLMMFSVERNF